MQIKRILVTCTVFLWFAYLGIGQEVYKNYRDGQLYVKLDPAQGKKWPVFSSQTSSASDHPLSAELINTYQIKKIYQPFLFLDSKSLKYTYKVIFDNPKTVEQLIEKFTKLKYVDYAEKVPLVKLSYTPNDTYYSSQQWYLPHISADQAWDETTGSPGVKVAITDNAIDTAHTDLRNNIWVNPGEIPGNSIDDDGNNYVDDVRGYDVADNDNDPTPPSNSMKHGTHVAGISGAVTDNSTGVASIGFNISIIPVKIGRDSDGALVAPYEGIQYAMAAGADVINMSWGSTGSSATEQNVITAAYNQGIVLVAAAGNSDSQTPLYPAAYNHVIAVASSNSSDQKSWFSNYGSYIDVTAPGSGIYSTVPGNSYQSMDGTSMAAPVVAGLAGLMRSATPGMHPDSVENCLESTADPMPSDSYYNNGDMGAGLVNALGAVQCAGAQDSTAPTANFTADKTFLYAGNSVDYTDLSTNQPTSWQWSFPGGTPNSSTNQHPSSIVYNTPGTYDVTLIASNTFGADTLTKSNYITVAPPPACDTITNVENDDTAALYSVPSSFCGGNGWGFVSGHNCYIDSAKADSFRNPSPSTLNYITGGYFYFGFATDGGNNTQVTVTVWDSAFNVAGTKNIPLSTIKTDVDSGWLTSMRFNPPIPVPSKSFFMGIQLNYGPGDTLGLVTTKDGNTIPNTAYEQWNNGTWHPYTDFWGISVAHVMWPILSDSIPQAQFTASADTICEGMSVTYDGSNSQNAISYYWDFPGGTPDSSFSVNPTITYNTPGTYSATLAVGNCGASDTLTKSNTVTVLAEPNVSVTPSSASICGGDTVMLVATGASSYSWSPATGLSATTGDTVYAFPPDSTTYQVQGWDPTGQCSGTDVAVINSRDKVNMSVTPDTASICAGDSVLLIASGAMSYTWSPSSGLNTTTNDTVIASPSSTTTYQVVGDSTGACPDTGYSTVLVGSGPVSADFTASDTAACEGDAITFDASSSSNASTYDWDFPGGTPNSGNAQVENITYNTAGTYDVNLIAINGCSRDTLTRSNYISIQSDPSVSVTPSSTLICNGDTTTLTANGASSYSWSPATGLSSSTGASVDAYPSSTTTYTVIGMNSNGCADTTTSTVNVSDPIVNVTPASPTICSGDSVSLTASGANNYSWSPAAGLSSTTGATVKAGPPSTTTYQVVGTDINGCQDTATVTVTVSGSTPTAAFTANDTSACGSLSTGFDASSSTNATSYSWSFPGGSPTSGTGVTPSVSYSSSGTYDVTLIVSNSCGSDTLQKTSFITVYNKPSVSVSPSSAKICQGDQVLLQASGANTYSWSPSAGLDTTAGSNVTARPTNTTTYTVIGTNSNNCKDTATVTVTISGQYPTADFSVSDTSGCPGMQTMFDASSSNNANSYMWQFQQGTPDTATTVSQQVTYSNSGTFDVQLVVGNSCGYDTLLNNNLINIHSKPSISVIPATTTICDDNSTTLNANGAPSYSWSPGVGLNQTTGATVTASPSDTTQYMVVGFNSFGCSDTTYSMVNVNNCSGIGEDAFGESINAYLIANDNHLMIQYRFEQPRSPHVLLYNQLGQLIYKEKIDVPPQPFVQQISTQGLSSGIYYLQVVNNKQQYHKKIFIK